MWSILRRPRYARVRAERSAHSVIPGPEGFDREALCAAVAKVGARDRIAGVVAGSGFEQNPTLLDALSTGAELLGNEAEDCA